MKHILCKDGKLRLDTKNADFVGVRKIAQHFKKQGRGVAEFVACMRRIGVHEEIAYAAFNVNGGRL